MGIINFVLQMYYKQLSREQRYAIYLGIKEGKTKTAIARQIEVSVSTVSREIRRNTNRQGHYVFQHACELAAVRKSEVVPTVRHRYG